MSGIFDDGDINAVHADGAKPSARGVFDDDVIDSVSRPATAATPASNTETPVGKFLHGAASLADTVLGVVPAAVDTAGYAISRAAGQTPENAQATAHRASELVSKPFGKAFRVTDTPGYKNEFSNQVQQFIGENVAKGADWIAQRTGMPKQDIENYVSQLSMAAPAAGPLVKRAAAGVKDAAIDSIQTQRKGNPSIAEAAKTPNLTDYEKVRATYNAPEDIAQYAHGGSAASGVLARLTTASKELQDDAQAVFSEAQQKHGAAWRDRVNWDALNNQLNADSLPVPGRLTAGQSSQNGALLSEEWNKRNTNGMGPIFAAQNDNQVANLRHIREEATPEVYTNTPEDHAQTLIDAYKQLHAQEKAVIDQKWDAIRKASSGDAIFDAGQMLKDAQAALKAKKLTAYDPGGQIKELIEDARRGGLSADGYVSWRQNLGREAMKGGNEGAAASAIIEATNNSRLLKGAEQYRDAVNDALATGRALHGKLAHDSAYEAVANGNASVKDFVNKFIINNKPEKVAQMRSNLVGNDVANQTMRAAVLDHLRSSAALDEQYRGNFAAKSFNKHLSRITPIARLVFDDGELQTLRTLGDYSKIVSFEDRNTWKNHSNTATELNSPTHAMAAHAGKVIGAAGEVMAAKATGGASIPLIGAIKEGMRSRAERKAALEEEERAAQYLHESTRPAAGIIK